jgi:threonine aldolase
MGAIARRHHLRVHLDGARLFNTAVALECDPASLTEHVDSVTFCLSKGLCAPVGSVLCGSREFIHEARRQRKLLGGGMRQAGILAAAGLVALDEMVDRLAEDHTHAARLAAGLAALNGIILDPERVRTNIVLFQLSPQVPLDAAGFGQELADDHGLQVDPQSGRLIRAVTHHGIEAQHVDQFITAAAEILTA